MSECRWYTQLNTYYDKELPAEQAELLAEHLKTCDRCAAELAQLTALSDMLKNAHSPVLRPEMPARVHSRVDALGERFILRMAEAFSALAAAILVACVLWLQIGKGTTEAYATSQTWESYAVGQQQQLETAPDTQTAEWLASDLMQESVNE